MTVFFSRTTEYAVQSALYLSMHPFSTPVLQRDMATALNIPPHFLGKILQVMVKNGIVLSEKGKKGGFHLAKSPEMISLFDIVKAIEGPKVLEGCLLGLPNCQEEEPCPLHTKWKPIKLNLVNLLDKNLSQFTTQFGQKLNWMEMVYQEF